MNRFKGTPAPWKYTIRNANEIMTTFHGVTIGDVYFDITTANEKAGSHLIAAAPELLKALINCRPWVLCKELQDKADSVIEKALGETK